MDPKLSHQHQEHGQEHSHEGDQEYNHSVISEIICHLPYAIFSVAFCLAMLSFLGFFGLCMQNDVLVNRGADLLFHSFHFMHIVFAATGAVITYLRFSKNLMAALLVGMFNASVFCTLSDAVLPYLGGELLGVDMHWHLCFVTEWHNVLPFLFVGLVNGVVLSKHHSSKQGFYSIFSHFVHILISSLASSFYLVANGYNDWFSNMGMIFLFLIVAVVVPCTLSDVVIPMFVAKFGKRK